MSTHAKVFAAFSGRTEVYNIYQNDTSLEEHILGGANWVQSVDEVAFYSSSNAGSPIAIVPIIPNEQDTRIGLNGLTCELKVFMRFLLGKCRSNNSSVKDLGEGSKIPFELNFRMGVHNSDEPLVVAANLYLPASLIVSTYPPNFEIFFSTYMQEFSAQVGVPTSVDSTRYIERSPQLPQITDLRTRWRNYDEFAVGERIGVFSGSPISEKYVLRFSFVGESIRVPSFALVMQLRKDQDCALLSVFQGDRKQFPGATQGKVKFSTNDFPSMSATGFSRQAEIVQRARFRAGTSDNLNQEFWMVDCTFPIGAAIVDSWKALVVDPISRSLELSSRASKLSSVPEILKSTGPLIFGLGRARYSVSDDIANFDNNEHLILHSIVSVSTYQSTYETIEYTDLPSFIGTFPSIKDENGKPLTASLKMHDARIKDSLERDRVPLVSNLKLGFQHNVEDPGLSKVLIGALSLTFVGTELPTSPPIPPPLASSTTTATSILGSSFFDCKLVRKQFSQSHPPGEPCYPFFSELAESEKSQLEIESSQLRLGLLKIGAAGQDPIPGAQFSVLFERSKKNTSTDSAGVFTEEDPIIFEIEPSVSSSSQTGTGDFTATFIERLLPTKNHSMDISISRRYQSGQPTSLLAVATGEQRKKSSYFVIDRNPFFIGLVNVDTVEGDFASGITSEIANFSLAGDQNWEIVYGANPSELVLPPQGVGESAEKRKTVTPGRLDNDIEEGVPIDFRFSPPTKLTLQGSYFQQRFGEVPWNLRRLLGYPGQRDAGCTVQAGEFELVYGLRGRFLPSDSPRFKISEIGAQLGRFPNAPPETPLSVLTGAQSTLFNKVSQEWFGLLQPLKSRLSILEVRSGSGSACINEGIGLDLRESAQLRNPTELPITPNSSIPEVVDGLPGGITWPVESMTVLNTWWANRVSAEASVSKLKFSPLGGWGSQVATFANNNIRVCTDTTMGRTHYIQVEITGRLTHGWNKARHVIVYERSVYPSRQFFAQQDNLYGIPVLRKMQEYVEIDDLDSPRVGNENKTFVDAIHFEECHRRIYVDSSWGRDIFDKNGQPLAWIVPLWNPLAYPSEVYPRPSVYLRSHGTVDGQSVSQSIEDPEKIHFVFLGSEPAKFYWPSLNYSNPHEWPSIPEIDFCNVASDALDVKDDTDELAKNIRGGDFSKKLKPYPQGLSRFTLTVKRAPAAANIVKGKADKSIGSSIRNLTLMRGSVYRGPEPDPTDPYPFIVKLPREGVENAFEIADEVLDLAEAGSLKGTALLVELTNDLTNAVDNSVKPALNALALADCTKFASELRIRIEREIRSIQARFVSYVDTHFSADALSTLRSNWITEITAAFGAADPSQPPAQQLAAVKASLKHRVSDLQSDCLGLVYRDLCAAAGLLDAVLKSLQDLVNALSKFQTRALALKNNLLTLINNFGSQMNQAYKNALATEISQFEKLIHDAVTRLKEVAAALVALFRPLLGRRADALGLAISVVEDTIEFEFKALVAYLNQVVQIADNADITLLKQEWIDEVDKRFLEFEDTSTRALDILQKLQTGCQIGIQAAQPAFILRRFETLRAELDREVDALTNIAQQQIITLMDKFESLLRAYVNSDSLPWNDVATALLGETSTVELQANRVCAAFSGEVTKLRDQLLELLKPKEFERLKDRLAAASGVPAISEVREELLGLRKKLLARIDQIETSLGADWVIEIPKNSRPGDAAMILVRAFGAAPDVPGLRFERPEGLALPRKLSIAFNYFTDLVGSLEDIADGVGISPSFAIPSLEKNLSLGPLSLKVPTNRLLNTVVPFCPDTFDLNSVIKDLSLFDCSDLFPNLKLPSGPDNIKVTHGVDAQSLSGWLRAEMDVRYQDKSIQVISMCGITISIRNARFYALSHVTAKAGQPPKNTMKSEISGDWLFELGGMSILEVTDAKLLCDERKKIKFDIRPENIKLQAALEFLSNLLSSVSTGNGFRTELLGAAIRSTLSLSMPDMEFGTFGIANLSLGFGFTIGVSSNGFAFGTNFSLASMEKPFIITVFALGGSGWLDFGLSVTRDSGKWILIARLAIGISAAASLGISMGPISGSISASFGIKVEFLANTSKTKSSSLTVGIVLVFAGHVDVLGIVTADVSLTLEANYNSQSGQLIGRGTVRLSVSICWCFTLHVDKSVEYKFGSSNGLLSVFTTRDDAAIRKLAERYVQMFIW